MKYTLLTITTVFALLPSLSLAQDAMLDVGLQDAGQNTDININDTDFEALFNQMNEEVRQDSITSSGFNEAKQTKANPAALQPPPARASNEDGIYSTDANEIILYRQTQEVKRLPLNVPIKAVQVKPDTGQIMSDESSFFTNTQQTSTANDGFTTNTLVQDTEFADMHSASGTGADAATGALIGETLDTQAVPASPINSNTLTMAVAAIAIVIGGLFGLKIMRKRKLDTNIPDMPSNLNDSAKMRKLEEALSKTH